MFQPGPSEGTMTTVGSFKVWLATPSAPTGDLVLHYDFNPFTNSAGVVPDLSGFGNNGTPGSGAALPTAVAATNAIGAHITVDGGDVITSTVSQAKSTFGFWAITNATDWRYYQDVDNSGSQFVNNQTEAFVLTTFMSTSGNTIVWGSGLTGALDDAKVYQVNVSETVRTNDFWSTSTNHGWAQWEFDNRDVLHTNVQWSGNFGYDFPADTSTNMHSGSVSGGGVTFGSDGTNGFYQFSGASQIDITSIPGISFDDENFTVSCWFQATEGQDDFDGFVGNRTTGSPFIQLDTGTSHALRWATRDNGGNAVFLSSTAGVDPTNGVWHLIMGIRDTDNNLCSLYIDGGVPDTVADTRSGNFISPSGNPWTVGSFGANRFVGNIKEAKIWDIALTGAQATNYFNDTKGKFGL